MFSGGAGSWGAAKRIAERHGTDELTLLFADTLIEDEDLYRYLGEAAANVGGELVRIAEGRDPWQVFFDRRFLGNSRIDPCSAVLKRDYMRAWLEEHCEPEETVVYLGFDWSEIHRAERAAGYWDPWRVESPLCDRPYLEKSELLTELKAQGIEPPRLYGLGFSHNNCGGFCIKAGQAQFEHLLRVMPERYRYHEGREQELREYLDKDVAILTETVRGEVRPLTLRAFRERLERQPELFDASAWGACSCFDGEA